MICRCASQSRPLTSIGFLDCPFTWSPTSECLIFFVIKDSYNNHCLKLALFPEIMETISKCLIFSFVLWFQMCTYCEPQPSDDHMLPFIRRQSLVNFHLADSSYLADLQFLSKCNMLLYSYFVTDIGPSENWLLPVYIFPTLRFGNQSQKRTNKF